MIDDPNSCFPARLIIIGVISLAHFASVATSFEVFLPVAAPAKSRFGFERLPHEKERGSRISWPLSLQSRASSSSFGSSFGERFGEHEHYNSEYSSYDREPPYGRSISPRSFFPRTRTRTSSATAAAAAAGRSKTVRLAMSSSREQPAENDGNDDDAEAKAADEAKRRETLNAAHDDLYDFLTGKTGRGEIERDRVRKRDQILGFVGRGSSEKKYVQPIRQEDGSVDEELVGRQQQQEERTRVRFDSLFLGMPTLEEIVSRNPAAGTEDGTTTGDANASANANLNAKPKRKTRMTDDDDFSWFEPERLQIEREYDLLRQETKQRIREQRLEEEEIERLIQAIAESENDGEDAGSLSQPNTIPDNAEGVADSILTQEMNRMIDAVQLERAKQRLQAFESQRTSELDTRNYQGVTDNRVENIIKETTDELEQDEKLKAGAIELEQYQLLRQQEASFKEVQGESVPQDGADLDNWTLDRLNEMLEKSENDEDGDGSITETLEENIEELRKQIQRESKKGSVEPQTMKEWQMYQAIATKLTKDQLIQNIDTDALDAIINDEAYDNGDDVGYENNVDEQQVAQQLDSWREYVETEDKLREKMSLSSGYELPFGHLGEKMDQLEATRAEESALRDEIEANNKGKSRREVRREVNMQAVQAMEDLIRKSDGRRAEFLKAQLEEIKAGMEENDYYDTEEEEEKLISLEPVDLTDVFGQNEEDSKDESNFSPEEMDGINQLLSFSGTEPQYSRKSETEDAPVQKQEPPNTPFFSDSFSESTEDKPPVPDTPFFKDTEVIAEEEEEVIDVKNKLGSADEQKLQKMFRQANIRSYAEQEAIRKNWEAYQEYEKGIRDKSGLSKKADGEDSPSLTEGVELDYDPRDVLNEDGDFDAEKVLSTIGPRPKKRSKPSEPPTSSTSGDVDASEAADAIYRSISATGGIGRESQDVRKKDREEYDAYVKKEQELKLGLEKLEDELEVDSDMAELEEMDINDPDYAEEVLEPRPFVKRKRKFDERELSDMGGILASSTDSEEEEDSDEVGDSGFDDAVPGWLKKEREAAGKSGGKGIWRKREKQTAGRSDGKGIGGAFLGIDDDDQLGDDMYGRETLEEYEKRKAGRRTNVGIDIRDALGRRGSDEPDYKNGNNRFAGTQDGWGEKDFKARKEKLLGYIQLDISEVNSLIALKESVYATGASKYLPRINKPFQEFGAIFRLEGVLVDTTGLEQKVWNRVASEFGLEEPLLEDIRRAAVLKPEDAVKEVFFTAMGDFILVRRIVDAYRRIFRQEFNVWASEEGIAEKYDEIQKQNNAGSGRGSLGIGFDVVEDLAVEEEPQQVSVPLDEGAKLRYLREMWTKTANQFGFSPPTNEQLAESSMVTPDIAVSNIFCWSEEQKQINKIVSAYSMMQAGKTVPVEDKPTSSTPSLPTDRSLKREEITDDMILELQFMAWGEVAEENSLEVPDPEMIVAAASINNPEVVILDGFRWTDDPSLAAELAASYEEYLGEYINRYINNKPFKPASTESNQVMTQAATGGDNAAANNVPTDEENEILSRQTDAWKAISAEFGFDVPSTEQIISVADMAPEDAVIRLILTNYDLDKCSADEEEEFYELLPEIVELYESVLKQTSTKGVTESGTTINEASPMNKASGIATEEDILSRQANAWKEIGAEYGLKAPSMEQIRSATDMSIEDAVHKLILMNNDIENCTPNEVEEFYEMLPEIIESFELALEKPSTNQSQKDEFAVESDPQQVSQDEVYCASFDAWTSVAWKLGHRLPTQEDVQFAMTVGPKRAVMQGFCWAESDEEADEIVQQYLNQIKGRRDEWVKQGFTTTIQVETDEFEQEELPMVAVLPEVFDWIKSLKAVEMGCGVVSHLESDQMKILLEYAGMSELFPEGNQVSYSNGYLLDNQQLLGTALRIERRPDHCVVFDTSPPACAAAHDFDMRSVALVGPFPRYELLDADTSAGSVDELTASNIRRLFGERIYDKPMLDTEGETPLDPSKKVQTKTQFEGDE